MSREVIATTKAPAAVGPYSQAIKANGFVFTAGQLGLDPATGKLVEGDVVDQARQALKNLQA
ncbi:MAG: Rid family hydrolase, partial [Anaerolineae bacterium]